MKLLADKIVQPLISEKASSRETRFNEFTIVVDQSLTKTEIAQAVTKLFGIKPISVRTVVFRKKTRRSTRGRDIEAKSYKKALVRLPEGKRLEFK